MRKTKEDRKLLLLEKLKREAMNRRQIADAMFCVQQTADDYIAELRAEKRIYVAFYHRTVGMPSPYFMTGDCFDAPRPKALNPEHYQASHKKRKAERELDRIRSSPVLINNEHLVSRCITSMVRNANMSPAIKLPD